MIDLTDEQLTSIDRLKIRWDIVHEPTPLGGSDKCVMVKVESSNGSAMWIGVEPDGYTHS